jgi:hypothetical protein
MAVTAVLTADPPARAGGCPATVTFTGRVTASKAGTVSYGFIRSDNTFVGQQTTFDGPGTAVVRDTWRREFGREGHGWEAIKILEPANALPSEPAIFTVVCS